MFVLRRQAVQSARGIRTARSTAQFSSSTSRTAHEAGHGHAAPKDEPLGVSNGQLKNLNTTDNAAALCLYDTRCYSRRLHRLLPSPALR